MFRCKTVVWSLFLWGLVFSYTLFTYADYDSTWRTVPVAVNIASNMILIILLVRDVRNTKRIVVALCWSILVSIGLILRIYDVIDAIALNIHVSIMTLLISVAWCIVSHANHLTEGGFHWYVWCMLVILTLCSTNNGEGGRTIYITAASMSTAIHILYIWHVFHVQSPGYERCKHVFRVLSCFSLSLTLLVSSILVQTDVIPWSTQQYIIVGVEVAAVVVIVIDSVIGFSHRTIKSRRTISHRTIKPNHNYVNVPIV